MSAQTKKLRRHRGVVVGFVEDLLPPDFHDWMDIPNWPETSSPIVSGLSPHRWGQLVRWGRTGQEKVVCQLLSEGRTAVDIGGVLWPPLTPTRVRQIATTVFKRVVAGAGQDPQGDMFGGDL